MIKRLSVSQISSFNVAEEGCEAKWYFKSVLKRPEPQHDFNLVGIAVHAQLKHHGDTGEDVLGAIARAGEHLLPAPGKGPLREWGLNDRPQPFGTDGKPLNFFPDSDGGAASSLVWAAGLPLIGFADLIDPRPEHRMSDGSVRSEPGTIEVLDFKTGGSIDRYRKPAEKLIETTQMPGYGVFAMKKYPWATHIRLSHLNFSTNEKKKLFAVKETIVYPVAEIRNAWYRVEAIAQRMKVVAELKEEEVVGNLAACEKYWGCPHKSYCSTFKNQSKGKRLKMGLLKSRTAAPAAAPATNGAVATSTTPWVPPAPMAVAAPAKAKPQIVDVPSGFTAAQAIAGPTYVSPTGAHVTLTGEAAAGWRIFTPVGGGAPVLLDSNSTIAIFIPPPPPAPIVVREPDAPPAPPSLAAQTAPAAKKRGRPSKEEVAARAAAAGTSSPAVDEAHHDVLLFINAIPPGHFTNLSAYTRELVAEIEEEFKVADIRIAPLDSNIAYRKWEGALAASVKLTPPEPGVYVAFTKGNDFVQIVAETLSEMFPTTRGV